VIEEGIGRKSLPALIIVSGLAGSGKTTLARALSRKTGIAYIDYDTVTEPFIRAVLERDGKTDFSAYAKAFRGTAYRAMLDVAFENIASGLDVIVSGPFGRESADPGFFVGLAKHYSCAFLSVVIEIVVSEEILLKRIMKRGSDRDARKIEQWDDFVASIDMQKRVWRPDIRIDVDETMDTDLVDIVAGLEGQLKAIVSE
jgi:predicted kinase